ncbi:ABC transporter permease [Rathayibacter sp. SD072]|uniref:ABC transporter permease n=1 Tax=Rathayibacter sp. SD072 TaxID=2781731 RepID=UPI001A95AC15|nr:ABC transporter permease [Rathayibacter sp. SD072]MBO0985558.1 ABC transporter permease [Rathayibacter sp. SD072]
MTTLQAAPATTGVRSAPSDLGRYLAGRIAQAVLVLWAAYTLTFAVLWLLPSDPLALLLSANNVELDSLSPQQLAEAQARYGLDQPVWQQYAGMLADALRGDFGTSITKGIPVTELIAQKLPGTLQISALAIGLALIGGTALAYLAAYVQWRPLKVVLGRLPSAGVAFPGFWIGLLLVQFFAFTLHLLPSTGSATPAGLILPAVTMAIPTSAMLAQVLTRSFADVQAESYITTARAKGLGRGAVQWRHAFRNASLPTLTILGVLAGNTVTGAIVAETIFARQGIGTLAQESVLTQDVPVVQAIVVLAAAVFVGINLLVDLLYPLLDPRITHTSKAARP